VRPTLVGQVCDANSEFFAYASTLSAYVYTKDRNLYEVLVGHTYTITGLRFHPTSEDLLATSSKDKTIKVWNVRTGKAIFNFSIRAEVLGLEWYRSDKPRETMNLIFATQHNLQLLDYSKPSNSIIKRLDHPVASFEQSLSSPNLIAAGCEDGTLVVVNRSTNRSDKKQYESAVTGLAWDNLSPSYFLVALKSGELFMRDGLSNQELVAFQKQSSGETTVKWIPSVPGGFVTVSDKTGVIREWNVSQTSPMRLLNTRKLHFQSISFFPGEKRALCTFSDGAVIVYDVGQKRQVWKTEGGHAETIFDNKFKSTDCNVLATASYDMTVKLWDVRSRRCIKSLTGAKGILYSVTWSPDGSRLAASSSTGVIYIYNEGSGAVEKELQIHTQTAYRVAWHPQDDNMLASISEDRYLCIFSMSGQVIRKFHHPAALYGVAWNALSSNLVAVASENGIIYVWDLNVPKESSTPRQLQKHNAKAFNVAWSPLNKDLLLSSSDDNTAILWNVPDGTKLAVLKGHTSCVRGVCWHPEIPHFVLTGSWDSNIIGWDTRDGTVIFKANYHHADVYGMDIHPQRPNLLSTSSRDTTIRLSSLNAVFPTFALRLLAAQVSGAECTFLKKSFRGAKSQALLSDLGAMKSPAEQALAISNTFSVSGSMDNLLHLYRNAVGEQCDQVPSLGLAHMSSVPDGLNTRAQEAELNRSIKFRGIGGLKKDEALREAAMLHLSAGNAETYCEIMVEIGDWNSALTVAPAVSLEYWAALAKKRANGLSGSGGGDSEAVPLLLAANDTSAVVDLYTKKGLYNEAFEVLAVRGSGGYDELSTASLPSHAGKSDLGGRQEESPRPALLKKPLLAPLKPVGSGKSPLKPLAPLTGGLALGGPSALGKGASAMGGARDNPEVQLSPKDAEIRRVRSAQAQALRKSADCVAAACCFLSVNDVRGAVTELLLADELEVAFGIASGPQLKHAAALLVHRCEVHQLWEAGAHFARLSGSMEEVELLGGRYRGSGAGDVDAFYASLGLPSVAELGRQCDAGEAAAEGPGGVAAQARVLLLARRPGKALRVALDEMKTILKKPTWAMVELEPLLKVLSACLPAITPESGDRNEARAYIAYLGGLQAMWAGHTPVVSFFFEKWREAVAAGPDVDFPVPAAVANLQELNYVAHTRDSTALEKLGVLFAGSPAPGRLEGAVHQALVNGRARTKLAGEQPNFVHNEITPYASNLPSQGQNGGVPSAVSGMPVKTVPSQLENGAMISQAEDAMLGRSRGHGL